MNYLWWIRSGLMGEFGTLVKESAAIFRSRALRVMKNLKNKQEPRRWHQRNNRDSRLFSPHRDSPGRWKGGGGGACIQIKRIRRRAYQSPPLNEQHPALLTHIVAGAAGEKRRCMETPARREPEKSREPKDTDKYRCPMENDSLEARLCRALIFLFSLVPGVARL